MEKRRVSICKGHQINSWLILSMNWVGFMYILYDFFLIRDEKKRKIKGTKDIEFFFISKTKKKNKQIHLISSNVRHSSHKSIYGKVSKKKLFLYFVSVSQFHYDGKLRVFCCSSENKGNFQFDFGIEFITEIRLKTSLELNSFN